jgi:tetratricopeptide (TPR) repeat protein
MVYTLVLGLLFLLAACNSQKQAEVASAPGSLTAEMLYQEGRAMYLAGEELERQGRHEEATGKFTEASLKFASVAQADPNHIHALINWGAALSRSGKLPQALSKFQEAVLKDPTKAEAYYNWGVALERQAKHKDAVEKYENALALNADLATPALRRYLERHRPQEQESRIKSTLPMTAPNTRR